ncbi:MAG: hypothetical protein RLZZ558_648, partial [Planctomycetota bacterium]
MAIRDDEIVNVSLKPLGRAESLF